MSLIEKIEGHLESLDLPDWPSASDDDLGVPFDALRYYGLLWLINKTVFHPRGFSMRIHFDDNGVASGWSLMGDGNEPFAFDEGVDGVEFDKVCGMFAALNSEEEYT